MRLRTFALAAFALTLALPVAALEARQEGPRADRAVEGLRADRALESVRREILLQADLATPWLGEAAVTLLQERALLATRVDELELVIEDGLIMIDAAFKGVHAAELLSRVRPGILVMEEEAPSSHAITSGRTWTRGSWMDSPDGAS